MPVIRYLELKLRTLFETTWYLSNSEFVLKDTIMSAVGEAINQYIVSFSPSSNAPIHTPSVNGTLLCFKIVSCVLPLEFSTAPISVVSVDPNLTLIASTYSPAGRIRSSTLLFIRPATKFVVLIGILLYPFSLAS